MNLNKESEEDRDLAALIIQKAFMVAMTRIRKKKYDAHMAKMQLELSNQKKLLVQFVKMESHAPDSMEKT